MNIKKSFGKTMERFDLLQSPFYQAWSAGTLSKNDLRLYTSEYGAFISLLPLAWKTLSDQETEHEEQEHYKMWEKFGASIGAAMEPLGCTHSKNLVAVAKELFVREASSIGALYAFEAQQPATAQSKLKGLREHYSDLKADEEYFTVHAHNEHEAEKLLKKCGGLSLRDRQAAMSACAAMSETLRKALDGIYFHSHDNGGHEPV